MALSKRRTQGDFILSMFLLFLPLNPGPTQEHHCTGGPHGLDVFSTRHVGHETGQTDGTQFQVRPKESKGQGQGGKGGVYLNQVHGKGKPTGQDLAKAQGVQEDGEADRTNVEQQESVHKLARRPRFDDLEKEQKVHVESQKVLGVQVKDFDRHRGVLVKGFGLGRAAVAGGARLGEARRGEMGSNQRVGAKHKDDFQDAGWPTGGFDGGPTIVIVIDAAHEAHEGIKNVFMHKGSRKDCLVGIISRVGQFGQDFEGKVSRPSLNNACTKKRR